MPPIKERGLVQAGTIKLRKQAPGTRSEIPHQRLAGTVRRNGQPVTVGWACLCQHAQREGEILNADVQRGRLIHRAGIQMAEVPLGSAGEYAFDVPYQGDWDLIIVEPHQAPTRVAVAIGLNESKRVDVTCGEGGTITGRVANVPAGCEGQLWVVAFDRTLFRFEARVGRDGTFRLEHLPPGEFGLKVGHEGYQDPEVPRLNQGRKYPPGTFNKVAEPFATAVLATVQPAMVSDGVVLELPKPGP